MWKDKDLPRMTDLDNVLHDIIFTIAGNLKYYECKALASMVYKFIKNLLRVVIKLKELLQLYQERFYQSNN